MLSSDRCNPFVQASFPFCEKRFWKILPRRLCYALQSRYAHFSIFFCYFLKNSNVVYPFNTSIIITGNKDNLIFKQRFGFVEDVKKNKLLKVFQQPPNGHGDCATHLMSRLHITSPSLPFTRSWGRQTRFWKFIENSSFDQKQKFLHHFAQHNTAIHLGKKKLGVIGNLRLSDRT